MKKIFEAITKFAVGFMTAFIVSNRSNGIPFWLNLLHINNISLQNTVISLLVTLLVTLIVEFIKLIFRFFSPMSIKIETNKNNISFRPKFNEYMPKKEKFTCTVSPGGRATMIILKKLNAALVLSFNPERLTLEIEGDPNWNLENSNKLSNDFIKENKHIIFYFLDSYNVNSIKREEYMTSVCMEIRPDMVKEQSITLNYSWNGHLNKVISLLCKVDLCKFKCEGKNE